ncbi:hypothetical protein Tco_1316878 [Tanacetum coccineum]
MRMVGKGFSGRDTPLFPTMMVQAQQEQGEGLEVPTDPYHTPTIIQPSTSQPQKKQKPRKPKRKDTKVPQPSGPTNNVVDEAVNEEMYDSLVRAATTSSSLEAEQDNGVLDGDEVLAESEVTIKDVNLSVDEVTLAQALAALKSAKVQEKANVVEEPSESITTTPTLTTITVATIITAVKSQDKGKGIMVEEPVKIKKKDQINLDEELAFKLQAKEEEERLAREKDQREEEANIVAWDNVQAMIDADYQMAQQMQDEEQEKLSIKEKSKLFVQLLDARKKHFVAIRAQEMRNKPPTKAQKRNTMSTYLKNMTRYKHTQLKNKIFDDIQKLFDKAMKRVNTFIDMDTELVEESIKKQKMDEDKETVELQRLIEIVPDKEEVAIDAISLETKPPSIVDYKIHNKGKKTYYHIIKADGSLKMYLVFSHMLKSFDREDLETLWNLVKAKHRVLDWKLYDSCGVHSSRKQNVHIHMLVEKRYPLTPAIITDMLNRKLQADHWNEMCYQLLKLIRKQLKNQ